MKYINIFKLFNTFLCKFFNSKLIIILFYLLIFIFFFKLNSITVNCDNVLFTANDKDVLVEGNLVQQIKQLFGYKRCFIKTILISTSLMKHIDLN